MKGGRDETVMFSALVKTQRMADGVCCHISRMIGTTSLLYRKMKGITDQIHPDVGDLTCKRPSGDFKCMARRRSHSPSSGGQCHGVQNDGQARALTMKPAMQTAGCVAYPLAAGGLCILPRRHGHGKQLCGDNWCF